MSAAFFGAFQPRHLQITRGGRLLPSRTSHSPLSSPLTSKNRRCSMLLVTPNAGFWSARAVFAWPRNRREPTSSPTNNVGLWHQADSDIRSSSGLLLTLNRHTMEVCGYADLWGSPAGPRGLCSEKEMTTLFQAAAELICGVRTKGAELWTQTGCSSLLRRLSLR